MITQILLQQTIIMFALMLLGLLLSRRGMITEQGSRDLSNVLLYAVIPCVILRSYMSEFSTEKLRAMGLSALIAVIAFAASIAVAYLTCGTRHRIENFAVAFGNAGFIGIPLVTAVFGPEAAFYVVSFSTFANLLQWTYGIVIISGKKETMNLRMVFVNPVFISMVIGIALFGAVGAHMFVAQAFQIFRQGLHGVPGIPGLGTGTGLFLRFRVLRVLHMHIIVLVVTIHGSSQKCTGVVPASIE